MTRNSDIEPEDTNNPVIPAPMAEPADDTQADSTPDQNSTGFGNEYSDNSVHAFTLPSPNLQHTEAVNPLQDGVTVEDSRRYQGVLPSQQPAVQSQGYPAWVHSQPQPYQSAQFPYGPVAPKEKKSRTGLIVTSTALIAVLLGGSAGYGGAWLYGQNAPPPAANIQGQSTVTINNPDKVNLATAVAAKASPSVVTLSVVAGQVAGTGSGVILTADGYVLTNNHVVTFDGVRAKPQISVKTSDGTLYNATIVATDPVIDLAVIKLEKASGLTPIVFADSDLLNVGDDAIAIGAPLGLEGTVTLGIISALNRSINVSAPIVPEEGNTNPEGDDFNFWNNTPELQNPNSSNENMISLPVIQTDA
ncbi:MAG: trypsin-like peptidase domain-containing protein, partial [Microbacteriaceae bacterium]